MRELPPGWAWTTLGEIAELKGGLTKGKRRRDEDKLRSVPYLRVENVQRGYLNLDQMKLIDATEAEIDDLRLRVGDVLFNEGGDRDKLGRGWVWQAALPECIHQNHVFRARLRAEGLQPKFISWYGNSEGAQYFNDHGKQTTNLASINLTKLSEFPVPLPPSAEQRRIVDEIEKQFTRLDYAVSALKAVLERVQAYSRATLNSHTRPASRDCVGWAKRSLNELSDIGTGVTPLRSNGEFWRAGTIPWVTSTAVNRPFVDEPQGFVTEVALKRTTLKVYSPGTLLIAMYGEGKTRGKVSELRISAAINQALAAVQIRPQWGEYREYTKLALTSAYDQIRFQASGGVQPNLNLGMIGAIEVWLPPQSEVARITSDLSAQVTDAAHMQSGVAVALARAAQLRQAILKKAFEGNLVAQDPNDEPASVLLGRIRSVRAHAPTRRRRDLS